LLAFVLIHIIRHLFLKPLLELVALDVGLVVVHLCAIGRESVLVAKTKASDATQVWQAILYAFWRKAFGAVELLLLLVEEFEEHLLHEVLNVERARTLVFASFSSKFEVIVILISLIISLEVTSVII